MGKFQTLYELTKKEVIQLLNSYEAEVIDTDEAIEPSLLFKADRELNDKLNDLQCSLEIEFNDDETALKRYGFHRIVKFFNPSAPASFYHIQIEKKWKQVNDPDKVIQRLDEELSVWSNSYRLHAYKELEVNKEADEAFITEQKVFIDTRIKEAAKECKKIKENSQFRRL